MEIKQALIEIVKKFGIYIYLDIKKTETLLNDYKVEKNSFFKLWLS
jgi:hypothetical protein